MKLSITVTDLWRVQECFEQLFKGAYLGNLETKQSFLCAKRRPDLIHIPMKMHDDIGTVTELWSVQECFWTEAQTDGQTELYHNTSVLSC